MAVSNFLRPELPYDYESLQNSNRYQLITADGSPPPPLMLDSEFNYLVYAVRTLDQAMNGLAIGIIPGANDPNNAGLFPTTDGSSNISWVRVSGPYIQDNSVPGSKLFAGTITSREIGDGTILSTKYGPKSIPTTALNDYVVTTNKLVDRNTTRQKIALKAIGNDELDDDAVQERNILDANVTRQKVALKAIGNDQLDDNSVQARNILDGNVTLIKLAQEVLDRFIPVGSIVEFAGTTGISSMWLECNGQAVSRATYPVLFTNIGTTYGSGDGVNTFNLPDRRGRTSVGIGSDNSTNGNISNATAPNITIGGVFGEERHQLTVNELASHTHDIAYSAYQTSSFVSQNNSGGFLTYRPSESTGGDQPHNNVQPSIFMRYYIRAS
ncbi:MAG: phage tail protein [Candidatus Nitrosocosmicus sp.]